MAGAAQDEAPQDDGCPELRLLRGSLRELRALQVRLREEARAADFERPLLRADAAGASDVERGEARAGDLERLLLMPVRLLGPDREAEEGERVPWGPHDDVPAWAFDPEARLLNAELAIDFMGPALRKAWRAGRDAMILFVLSFAAVLALSQRTPGGLARCPPWLALVLALGLLRLLWLEHGVRKYVLVPIARRVASDEVPPVLLGIRRSFKWWILFNSAVSFAPHLDVMTNGVFSARVLRTDLCGGSAISTLWAQSCRRSVIPALGAVPFSAWVLLGWFFMALQASHALWHAWPLMGKDEHWEELRYGLLDKDEDGQSYPTRGCATANHGDAFEALLPACRMTSLTRLWRKSGLAEVSADANTRYQIPSGFGTSLEQLVGKLVLFNLLEGPYQPNVQVAALGLSRAVDRGAPLDLLTAGPIGLGLALGAYAVWQELAHATQLRDTIASTDIDKELGDFLEEQVGMDDAESRAACVEALNSGDDQAIDEVGGELCGPHWPSLRKAFYGISSTVRAGHEKQGTVRRTCALFLSLVVLWAVLAGRAAVYFAMVVWCPTGLYNLGAGFVDPPSGPIWD